MSSCAHDVSDWQNVKVALLEATERAVEELRATLANRSTNTSIYYLDAIAAYSQIELLATVEPNFESTTLTFDVQLTIPNDMCAARPPLHGAAPLGHAAHYPAPPWPLPPWPRAHPIEAHP